ncbi:phage terminase small subunit P27 family [Staphylococcus kloosii]|uniref:phage terminase small subunit P27 family n=1 Tax=Staphylococcus kloosii TaxID=29384 RepID=UPI00189C98C8|nr:phage terminase small subunit P27 family [Staphylococcus kloosii]MBF7025936.1 phage terminase small subunit P27 family [Staphylococcus kloosii]
MARPKKPLDQQKTRRTKEVQEELKATEEKLNNLEPLQKSPPSYLTKEAKAEYRKLYPLIMQLPVANLDLSLLSTYCQSYADYQQATKELAKQDVVTFTERGSKVNPWHRVKVDSFNIMNSIAPKLGLTIDSRMKIMTPKNDTKEVDPFEEFMKDE